MENNKRLVDLRLLPELVCFRASGFWQRQTNRAGSEAKPEGLEESEMIINRVHVSHADIYKIGVNASPVPGLIKHPGRHGAYSCVR